MISVSADESLREASAFAKEVKATFPVVHDIKAKMTDQFGVEGLPSNIIVGRNGKILASIEGVDTKALDAAVAKAVASK